MFYALAHFAKYIPPGSRRVFLESTSDGVLHAAMESGAFLRPDGLVAIVVLNRGTQASSTTDYSVRVGEAGNARWINMRVPAHSFQTIVFMP